MDYYEPEFLLGMTATPERTDSYNICKDFDYNIAYEIRLEQAMEENMLSPFHYFGISELTIDGNEVDENTDFRLLVSNERVNHIIEKIKFYGHDGEHVRGLVFCSRNDEARELSNLFNARGFKTAALSGSDSQEEREAIIERLESDVEFSRLDYIFTVDIFNEGVDIPCINQVVMLRPTKSAIIFVQQLGRGLRKTRGKEFVVVLDFIGNYSNNFMIPMALSDDRSYNKDNVRRFVSEGSRVIPGCSTINFDTISKKKIYEAIDNVNFNSVKYIKDSYQNLKFRLGRIPKLMDFEEHDSMDMARIITNNSIGSYYMFLVKYETEFEIRLNDIQKEMIEFISKKIALGKRLHELIVLEEILKKIEILFDGQKMVDDVGIIASMEKRLVEEYDVFVEEKTRVNVVNVLTNEFATGTARETYKNCVFIEDFGRGYDVSDLFLEQLREPFFMEIVKELVEFGFYRNKVYYGERYKGTSFQLYQKYSYEDVCRLLEWEKNVVAQNIGGYKYDDKTKTYPVFINYNKEDHINDSIKYEDRFRSSSRLIAISKSKRKVTSPDIVRAYGARDNGVKMELFVRKNKDDKVSKEFYYLGRMDTVGDPKPIIMGEAGLNAVELEYQLDTGVREDVYEFIVEE